MGAALTAPTPLSKVLMKEAAQQIALVIQTHAEAALEQIESAKGVALKRIEELSQTGAEFSFEEAAKYLRISVRTMRDRVQAGDIAYRRNGKKYIFTRTALDEYKAKNERPAV